MTSELDMSPLSMISEISDLIEKKDPIMLRLSALEDQLYDAFHAADTSIKVRILEALLAGDDPDQDKLDIAADLLFTMADLESVSWIPEKLLKYIGRAYDLLTQGLTEAEGNYEFDRMHQENLHTLLVSWLVNKPIPVEYMIQLFDDDATHCKEVVKAATLRKIDKQWR